jgi:hypothetical protein
MMIREAPLRLDPDRTGEDKNLKLGGGKSILGLESSGIFFYDIDHLG